MIDISLNHTHLDKARMRRGSARKPRRLVTSLHTNHPTVMSSSWNSHGTLIHRAIGHFQKSTETFVDLTSHQVLGQADGRLAWTFFGPMSVYILPHLPRRTPTLLDDPCIFPSTQIATSSRCSCSWLYRCGEIVSHAGSIPRLCTSPRPIAVQLLKRVGIRRATRLSEKI